MLKRVEQLLSPLDFVLRGYLLDRQARQLRPKTLALSQENLTRFSAYTWLLRVTTIARASTYAYVNPLVAMFLGWALAGEALTLQTLLATTVIVGGVVLIISQQARCGLGADHAESRAHG